MKVIEIIMVSLVVTLVCLFIIVGLAVVCAVLGLIL